MKVYLAVGHGRRPDGSYDPGATLGAKTEQNQGAPIVAAAAARLRQLGHTVKAQREGDGNFPIYTAEANAWGADVAITVHHDWSGAPRGAFGHWHSRSSEAKRLADAIYGRIEQAGLPTRPSWHRARDELHFVRNTRMPAVLWECDRIGSVRDLAGYGRLLAEGINDYRPVPGGQEDDDMTPDQARKLDELHAALTDGNGVFRKAGDDLRLIRLALRAIAAKLGLRVRYSKDVPDRVDT